MLVSMTLASNVSGEPDSSHDRGFRDNAMALSSAAQHGRSEERVKALMERLVSTEPQAHDDGVVYFDFEKMESWCHLKWINAWIRRNPSVTVTASVPNIVEGRLKGMYLLTK